MAGHRGGHRGTRCNDMTPEFRELLDRAGMEQVSDLARASRVPITTLANYARGRCQPTRIDILMRIQFATKLEMTEIISLLSLSKIQKGLNKLQRLSTIQEMSSQQNNVLGINRQENQGFTSKALYLKTALAA